MPVTTATANTDLSSKRSMKDRDCKIFLCSKKSTKKFSEENGCSNLSRYLVHLCIPFKHDIPCPLAKTILASPSHTCSSSS